MAEIRVIIADDDPLVRLALAHLVTRDGDVRVIGEADDGQQTLDLIEKDQPDVVMMDIQMPVLDGIEATEAITKRWPDIRVLAVTTLDSRETVLPMLAAGAAGYMLKDSSAEAITDALRQVHAGESSLSPQITALLVQHVRASSVVPPTGDLPQLTDRESQVLHQLSLGMSNSEMAESLNVSEGTIKAHLGSIMSKWNVRDRVQVLVAAARAGLVDFS